MNTFYPGVHCTQFPNSGVISFYKSADAAKFGCLIINKLYYYMLFDFAFPFAIILKVAQFVIILCSCYQVFSNGLHSLYILINFRFFNRHKYPEHLDDVINGEFMQVEFNQICEFFKPHPFFDETTFRLNNHILFNLYLQIVKLQLMAAIHSFRLQQSPSGRIKTLESRRLTISAKSNPSVTICML